MTISIHEDAKARLKKVISKHLKDVEVKNNMFINRLSAILLLLADQVLSDRSEEKKQLQEMIDENPIHHFLFDEISRELYERDNYSTEVQTTKLTNLAGYENTNEVAQFYIDKIETLPWKYIFTLEIHEELSQELIKTFDGSYFNGNIRFTPKTKQFDVNYPLSTGNEAKDKAIYGGGLASLLIAPKERFWADNKVYLQIETSGFVGYYANSETYENVLNEFKTFCGLSLALRLFKMERKYKNAPFKERFYIHKHEMDHWVLDGRKNLDSDISDAFQDLTLHNLDGTLDSDEKKSAWLRKNLITIEKLFKNKVKAQKIFLASRWLFDGHSTKNTLLAFIQLTTVLEILLGDKKTGIQVGVSTMLKNRCAYLIGSSNLQRKELLDDFDKIYDIRSHIVHTGKTKLSNEEYGLLNKLKWMCRRVIQEEIKLLMKDIEK